MVIDTEEANGTSILCVGSETCMDRFEGKDGI